MEMATLVVDNILGRPAESTMVEDYLLSVFCAQRLVNKLGILYQVRAVPTVRTRAEAHVTHHYVLRPVNTEHAGIQRYALARRRLARNGEAGGTSDAQHILEDNPTGAVKHHGDRLVRILSQSPAQRTYGRRRGVILKISHRNHTPATATRGKLAETLGRGKSRYVFVAVG